MIKNKGSLIVAVFALLASSHIASASLAVYSYSGTTTTTGGGKSLSTTQTGTMVIDLDTMAATYVGHFSTGSGKTIKNWWMSAPLSDAISTQILGPKGASYTLLAVGGNPGSRYTGSVAHFENAFGLNSRLTIRNKGITETAILPKTLSSPSFVISEDNTYDYFTQSTGTYTFNSAATLAYNNLNKSFSTAVTELENAYKARKFTQWSSSNLIGMPTPIPTPIPTPAPTPTPTPAAILSVTTLAGGVVNDANFWLNFKSGVASDVSGNVYLSDSVYNRIRKLTPQGALSTLAGSGASLYADGTGTLAKFYEPSGLATDISGNIYVADCKNNCVRKVTASGVVTTLSGYFNGPRGVTVDASGNVFVADTSNHKICKISPSGQVSTLAGSGAAGYSDGTGTAAYFNQPCGLAVDPGGNVYVADNKNHMIRKVSPAGVVTTIAGKQFTSGFVNGVGTSAVFNYPSAIALDNNGYIYVADFGNHMIRKISPTGAVTTLAGSGMAGYSDGTGNAAAFMFNSPSGIALDVSGSVYVADYGNNRIRKITISQ
jgi:sugar lactone lactonase YvrE